MRQHPQLCLNEIKRMLVSRGIIAYGRAVDSPTVSASAAVVPGKEGLPAVKDAPSSSRPFSGREALLGQTLSGSVQLWADIPMSWKTCYWQACEPVSLGPNAVKGLLRKGCRHVPKKQANEFDEFLSDIDPNSYVGDCRDYDSVEAYMVQKNIANGRRARDLQLPPAWDSQGIYRCSRTGNRVASGCSAKNAP